jgi:threonine synthase
VDCGSELDADPVAFACPKCGGILELRMTKPLPVGTLFPEEGGSGVWRYRSSFPVRKTSRPVTMGEGGTPLVQSVHIGSELGLGNLFFKVEGQNPTGSFKDRGMTVAVTRAVESGAEVLVCASTGNTSASLAAYASRAGLKSAVVLPSGKVTKGKLTQAVAHGAKLVRVADGFDRALELTMKAVAGDNRLYLMNSVNPYRIEGQKTVAFEIYEQLGNKVPDYVVLPVGNAGNISAVWKGFKELQESSATDRIPRLIGVQAEGASPIVEALDKGREVKSWAKPETVASAIRIGNPVSWKKAVTALRDSGGIAMSVTDSEIVQARRDLASKEGEFVENASATPIAALRKSRGIIKENAIVVCITTGHGLKEAIPDEWGPTQSPPLTNEAQLVKALLG